MKRPLFESEHYDSTVDNVNDPSIYVIYDKAQCYPQHLILYSPAQVKNVKVPPWMIKTKLSHVSGNTGC